MGFRRMNRVFYPLSLVAAIVIASATNAAGGQLGARGLATVTTDEGAAVYKIKGKGGQVDVYPAELQSALYATLSPDESYVVTAGKRDMTLWNARSGQPIRRYSGDTGGPVAFDGAGTRIASSRQGTSSKQPDEIVIHSRDESEPTAVMTSATALGELTTLIWTPDGRFLYSGHHLFKRASGGGKHVGIVAVWNVEERRVDRVVECDGSVIQILADQRLAICGVQDSWGQTRESRRARSISVVDIAIGKTKRSFSGLTSAITAAALTRDGATLLVGTLEGTLHIWDVETGKAAKALSVTTRSSYRQETDGINSLLVMPDKTVVVTYHRGSNEAPNGHCHFTTKRFDMASGMALKEYPGIARPLLTSSNGRFFIAMHLKENDHSLEGGCSWYDDAAESLGGDGQGQKIDTDSGRILAEYRGYISPAVSAKGFLRGTHTLLIQEASAREKAAVLDLDALNVSFLSNVHTIEGTSADGAFIVSSEQPRLGGDTGDTFESSKATIFVIDGSDGHVRTKTNIDLFATAQQPFIGDEILSVSDDAKKLVIITAKSELHVVDIETGRIVRRLRHRAWDDFFRKKELIGVKHAALSQDQKELRTEEFDLDSSGSIVRIFDAGSLKEVFSVAVDGLIGTRLTDQYLYLMSCPARSGRVGRVIAIQSY